MRKIFLLTGVMILGIGLLLSSCGGSLGNPMTKALAEAGQCAVSFDGVAVDGAHHYISSGAEWPKLRNPDGSAKDFTLEAWIKTTSGGPIYSRGQDLVGNQTIQGGGIALYVHQGAAKFIVDGAFNPFPNPSFQIASSFTAVNDGKWHHIAGVLVQQTHNHTPTTGLINPNTGVAGTCNAVTGPIHIDIYVDGVWEECVDIAAIPTVVYDDLCEITNPTDPDYLQDIPCVNNIGRDLPSFAGGFTPGGLFTGTIDELRIWAEARSQKQIDFWRNTEIRGEEEWSKADPNNAIAAYWSFNECTGSQAIDRSGYGNLGSGNLCVSQCNTMFEKDDTWTIDWVSGHELLY